MHRLMRFFNGSNLKPPLRDIATKVGQLAATMDSLLEASPEKSAGMRKLLEAKDCFVRAKILDAEFAQQTSTDDATTCVVDCGVRTPLKLDEFCGAMFNPEVGVFSSWACTRKRGHIGQHIACSPSRHNLARWTRSTDTSDDTECASDRFRKLAAEARQQQRHADVVAVYEAAAQELRRLETQLDVSHTMKATTEMMKLVRSLHDAPRHIRAGTPRRTTREIDDDTAERAAHWLAFAAGAISEIEKRHSS